MTQCETCAYYAYDEEWEEYLCMLNLDEDDYARLMQNAQARCPFWRDGDEYRIAGKQ